MLNKEQFTSLKENAQQRLGVWTTKAKETGIDRLILKYPNGLQKIKPVSRKGLPSKVFPDPAESLVGRWRMFQHGVIRGTKSGEECHVDTITGTRQNSSTEALYATSCNESKRSISDTSLLESVDHGRRSRTSRTRTSSNHSELDVSQFYPDGSSSTKLTKSSSASSSLPERKTNAPVKSKTRGEGEGIHKTILQIKHLRKKRRSEVTRLLSLTTLRINLRFLTSITLKDDAAKRAAQANATQRSANSSKVVLLNTSQHRFRLKARSIMHIIHLFTVTSQQLKKAEEHLQFSVPAEPVLCFDLKVFTNASTSVNGLSHRARMAICKPANERSDKDISCLLEIINRMPVFSDYSPAVHHSIAALIEYSELEEGRVVIRQGGCGSQVYWVVSGKLNSYMTETNRVTGDYRVQFMSEYTVGTHFGSLLLYENTLHGSTIVCEERSELLSLCNIEVNKILKQEEENEQIRHREFLKSTKYFSTWSPSQLLNCSSYIELKKYDDNEVIFDDHMDKKKKLYIIENGTCNIIRCLSTVSIKSPYRSEELLLPQMISEQQFMSKPYGRGKGLRSFAHDSRFIKIYTLLAGDYFNAGENLEDSFVIANGKVSCMEVSHTFYDINLKKHELLKMAETRQMQLLNNKELYNLLIINRRWQKYKEKLVQEIKDRKNLPTFTTLKDVPRTIIEDAAR